VATLACKKRQTKLISIGKGMPNAVCASLSRSAVSFDWGLPDIHVLTAIYEPK